MSNRSVMHRWWAALPCVLLLASPAQAADPVPVPAAPVPAAPAPAPAPAPSVIPPTPSDAPAPPVPADPVPALAPSAAPDAQVSPVPAEPSAAGFYGAAADDAASSAAATYPKLELSGFADFSFTANVSPKNSPLRTIAYQYPSFSIGNLNLYLGAALAENWHFLAEVRFLYLPQGNAQFPSNTGEQVVPFDAAALDYADENRALAWGGVQIQRAQIDFAPHPLLNFRFGQWLTPVGIWNVDHGSPTVIGVYRPFIIGQGLFPERQTGIQVSGEWTGDTNLLGYFATLSNGRGPSDAFADLDGNKGIGTRLYWTNTNFGSLTVGASAYKGTYSSRNREYGIQTLPGQAPSLVGINPLTMRYREQSVAGDVRWSYSGLLVQGEVMQREVVYQDGLRPSQNGTIFADFRERGYYALAGYRLPWFGIMPFATVEGYNFASQPFVPAATAQSIGLNIRPEPTVVIKLQYHVSHLGDDSSPNPYRGTLLRVLSQLAVAF